MQLNWSPWFLVHRGDEKDGCDQEASTGKELWIVSGQGKLFTEAPDLVITRAPLHILDSGICQGAAKVASCPFTGDVRARFYDVH